MQTGQICSEASYRAVLREIESLMLAEAGTPAGERLDFLAAQVEEWESKHYSLAQLGQNSKLQKTACIQPLLVSPSPGF